MKCPDAAELAACLEIAARHISLVQHRHHQGRDVPDLPNADSQRIAMALVGWHEWQPRPGDEYPELVAGLGCQQCGGGVAWTGLRCIKCFAPIRITEPGRPPPESALLDSLRRAGLGQGDKP